MLWKGINTTNLKQANKQKKECCRKASTQQILGKQINKKREFCGKASTQQISGKQINKRKHVVEWHQHKKSQASIQTKERMFWKGINTTDLRQSNKKRKYGVDRHQHNNLRQANKQKKECLKNCFNAEQKLPDWGKENCLNGEQKSQKIAQLWNRNCLNAEQKLLNWGKENCLNGEQTSPKIA